jgi:hypothetical protein
MPNPHAPVIGPIEADQVPDLPQVPRPVPQLFAIQFSVFLELLYALFAVIYQNWFWLRFSIIL